MGKRYRCDYCDKTFPDNPSQRKRHIQGLHHQRMRKIHYDSFRDPTVILTEELNKTPCRNFLIRGHCDFDKNCRYSHLTEDGKQKLRDRIKQFKEAKKPTKPENPHLLEEWLAKSCKKSSTKEAASSSEPETASDNRTMLPMFSLPPYLSTVPNLPTSLLPPPPDAFHNVPLSEWG